MNYLLSHVNTTGEHTSASVNKYQQPEGKKKRFTCWYTNADTLTNKLLELSTRIKSAEIAPSIIAITEAKPKKYRYQVTAAEFKIDGYDIFTSNIPGHQGRGIIVYTASELRAHEITLNTKFEENLTVCIKLENDDKLMVTCIYRSPSSLQPNNKALCDLISEIDRRPEQRKLMVGDFNYPSISWDDLHINRDANTIRDPYLFKEAIIDTYMTQYVNFPTRARGSDNPSCIDWLFANNEALINGIMDSSPLGGSDHIMIETDLNIKPKDSTTKYTKYYYDKGNYEEMRNYVVKETESIPQTDNIDELWEWLTSTLNHARDQFIPHKEIKDNQTPGKKRHTNHYDEHTIRKIRRKHKCWQRYMETRSGEKYMEYRRLCNQVKNMTKKSKKKIEREIARDSKANPKKFWQYVNKKTSIRQGVPDLVYEDDDGNEKNTTNDQEKDEVLADFFSSVFTEEDTRKMPHMTQRNFKEWLTNINISKEKIKKKLLELKISKAPGPDGLHPRLLKELAAQLSEPLESIFQLSLKQGKVPNDWRKGEITAIHKKGNRRTAGNYRPVSLTCILCKIMEALVREDIITHMRDNKLFSKYQYGFINKRSTTLQLLYVLDEWTEILDQEGTIDAVYLDFMKAFDKVPHKRLLHKLSAYGIGGQAHKWIESFLTGRTQRVKVDSATSGWRKVTSGIPQGFVLGPILFVMYINDMPEALVNNSTAAMFADDTKLYRRTDLPNGVQDLQEDLDHIFQWSDTWLMKV